MTCYEGGGGVLLFNIFIYMHTVLRTHPGSPLLLLLGSVV